MTRWKVVLKDGREEKVEADEWDNEHGMLVLYYYNEENKRRVVLAYAAGTWLKIERIG